MEKVRIRLSFEREVSCMMGGKATHRLDPQKGRLGTERSFKAAKGRRGRRQADRDPSPQWTLKNCNTEAQKLRLCLWALGSTEGYLNGPRSGCTHRSSN